MRVMLLHEATADTEAGILPKLDQTGRFRGFIGERVKAGIFRDGNGLRASSLGVRLTFAAGKRTIQEGPFAGRNEDPAARGGFALDSVAAAVSARIHARTRR